MLIGTQLLKSCPLFMRGNLRFVAVFTKAYSTRPNNISKHPCFLLRAVDPPPVSTATGVLLIVYLRTLSSPFAM
jgi:hypothetical protein